MTDKRDCRVCGGDKVKAMVKFNGWQVYHCRGCGFRFADGGEPIVYDEHYDETYFVPFTARDQTDKWTSIYKDRLTYLRENAPTPTLLEAGAGASVFALNAVEYGFKVSVVDAAPWAVSYLTSHQGVSGSVADLNAVTLPSQAYGAIPCAHVLEHLTNPRAFLEECYQTPQHGGFMYL